MLGQTFSNFDILRLITLIFLEVILSVDNGLALALIVKRLPVHLRKKALFLGLFSSFILRATVILFAAYLIQIALLQILGGLYLVYLSISSFFMRTRKKKVVQKRDSFLKVVILVELTDFAFAIDSILAGLALIGSHTQSSSNLSKIWILYLGGMVGMIFVRFAVTLLSRLIDRFPGLEFGGHLIVGWVGLKLLLTPIHLNGVEPLFWIGTLLFFSISFFLKKKPTP